MFLEDFSGNCNLFSLIAPFGFDALLTTKVFPKHVCVCPPPLLSSCSTLSELSCWGAYYYFPLGSALRSSGGHEIFTCLPLTAPVSVPKNGDNLWHVQDLTVYLVLSKPLLSLSSHPWEGNRRGFIGKGDRGETQLFGLIS